MLSFILLIQQHFERVPDTIALKNNATLFPMQVARARGLHGALLKGGKKKLKTVH
jgi:hypothetical protein